MRTEGHVRSRGLASDLGRAIGWLAIGKVVSKAPRLRSEEPREHERAPVKAPPSVRLSKLEIFFASIAGVVLALFPRQSDSRNVTS